MRGVHVAGLVAFGLIASMGVSAELTTPPPDEMKTNLVKVLRTTNKAQVNQYVCKVYDVQNVNPFEIINFPELLAEAEEGMIYSFVHPDGNKGKILATVPEYQIPYLDQLIASLDRTKLTSMPGTKWTYYRAKNRTAPYLALLGTYYGGSQDVFYPDPETNSVLIVGVPSGCDAAEAALNAADVPSPMAVIEVTVFDVKLRNDGTLGFDFHAWKNGPGRALAGAGVRYQWLGINKVPGLDMNGYDGAASHGQGFFLDYASAYFDFLVEKGNAKVLTSMRLPAMNQRRATFASSGEVLFYHVSQNNVLDRQVTGATQPRGLGEHVAPLIPPAVGEVAHTVGLSGSAPPAQAILPVRTGVFVDVLPVINQEVIEMDLAVRIVTLTGYDDTGRPVLSSRQFTDSSHVASGQELVIGGIHRERKVKATRKIPILGSLPVLGWVFGGEIGQTEKSMTVIVVKPVVEQFDSPETEADRMLQKMARGEEVVPLPQTPYGFDQWLFDRDQ